MLRIITFLLTLLFTTLTSANPTMMLRLHSERDGFFDHGSAVLIKRNTNCLATNRHVTAYADIPGVKLFVVHAGHNHEVVPVWEHKSEDAALVCFVKKVDDLPQAAVRSAATIVFTDNYIVAGYPTYNLDKEEPTGDFHSAEVHIDTDLAEVASTTATETTASRLMHHGAQTPRVVLSKKALSCLLVWEKDRKRKFGGISGGGLFTKSGELAGIVVMSNDTERVYAIPITLIPKRFFEK